MLGENVRTIQMLFSLVPRPLDFSERGLGTRLDVIVTAEVKACACILIKFPLTSMTPDTTFFPP